MVALSFGGGTALTIAKAHGPQAAPNPGEPGYRATIRLQNLTPSDFITQVSTSRKVVSDGIERTESLLPRDIERIDTDDIAGTVTIHGSPDSVQKIQEFVGLLDVPAKRARLHARIVRYRRADFSERGVPEVIALGSVATLNNRPASLTLFGAGRLFTARITPHINGDRSVSLVGSLSARMLSEPGTPATAPAVSARTGAARINQLGDFVRLTGTTSAADPQVQEKVIAGRQALVPGAPPMTTFFLEVTTLGGGTEGSRSVH
jgi:hypothetical protein